MEKVYHVRIDHSWFGAPCSVKTEHFTIPATACPLTMGAALQAIRAVGYEPAPDGFRDLDDVTGAMIDVKPIYAGAEDATAFIWEMYQ